VLFEDYLGHEEEQVTEMHFWDEWSRAVGAAGADARTARA
tara:strand:+ start:544 stop:663 length:120 start_codon:yes stop_codon:yes gene_type:complete